MKLDLKIKKNKKNWDQIFPMKQSELKKFISVESYDERTVENYRNCYLTEKRMVSKLSYIDFKF